MSDVDKSYKNSLLDKTWIRKGIKRRFWIKIDKISIVLTGKKRLGVNYFDNKHLKCSIDSYYLVIYLWYFNIMAHYAKQRQNLND